jgi:ABC-type branched-subunit amino acid transport system substrate-binding protein
MRRGLRIVAAALLLSPLVSCDRGGGAGGGESVLVVLSVPVSRSPWIAESVQRGATLAQKEINDAGGIEVDGKKRRIDLEVLDHGNSPQTAQANARSAVEKGAAVLITDGVGAVAVAGVTGPADLPTFITFEGGTSLIDEDARPTLFRMAPANRPMTRRLADYLAEKKPRLALITDDTSYGKDGRTELKAAIALNRTPVADSIEVPAGSSDLSAQVLRARRSGADTVIVWGRAPTVTEVVRAARASGWTVPIYSSPTGEDPLVRQQLAEHPEWVDGLTFVSFRITAEIGPKPWEKFRTAYEKEHGPEEVGVVADGRPVVQPPDWAMYPYDTLYLLKAALERSGGPGKPLIEALNTVSIVGANGDERSFGPRNHEGVSQDDMYFGRFEDMRFAPVEDDILSTNLPPVPQG